MLAEVMLYLILFPVVDYLYIAMKSILSSISWKKIALYCYIMMCYIHLLLFTTLSFVYFFFVCTMRDYFPSHFWVLLSCFFAFLFTRLRLVLYSHFFIHTWFHFYSNHIFPPFRNNFFTRNFFFEKFDHNFKKINNIP